MAFSPRASTPSGAPDPILAAIAAHRAAWQAYAVAPDGLSAQAHHVDQRAALSTLLGTPCATRAGAEGLLRHLRTCLAADGTSVDLGPFFARVAHARAQDLALTLDVDQEPAPRRLGEIVAAIVRRLRGAGEALAALVLVVGGALLIGAASLL
ncbi:hypothetical protein ACQVP2_29515 [Methylobacterium aquaticum]|uniref:hypothetical protein n=1 Tax=Methylobacterium aquaticum TaxID=270351 RepID=UPI003D186DCF